MKHASALAEPDDDGENEDAPANSHREDAIQSTASELNPLESASQHGNQAASENKDQEGGMTEFTEPDQETKFSAPLEQDLPQIGPYVSKGVSNEQRQLPILDQVENATDTEPKPASQNTAPKAITSDGTPDYESTDVTAAVKPNKDNKEEASNFDEINPEPSDKTADEEPKAIMDRHEEEAEEDDDDDDDRDESEAEFANAVDGGDTQEDQPIIRYEIEYWAYHLREAERLWSEEEQAMHPAWKELWKLALEFLKGTSKAFEAWQSYLPSLIDANSWSWTLYSWPVDIFTPLQVAAACGLTSLCKILLDHEECATAMTDAKHQALWFAVDHSTALMKLLIDHGCDPNACTELSEPAFHQYLELSPTVEGVRLMLDSKADCKMKATARGFNALHLCAWNVKDVEILRLLLDKGAEVNSTDNDGETPLHWLLWQNPLPIPMLTKLLQSGAQVNMSDKDDQQPLFGVCIGGSAEGCGVLLEHGAIIDHADATRVTALQAAGNYGNLDCVKKLIENGADIMKADEKSRTVFYKACAEGHVEVVKYLMQVAREKGLHDLLHKPMDDGRSPFSKACGK